MSNLVRELTDELDRMLGYERIRTSWNKRLLDIVINLARDRQPNEYYLDVARAAIREYKETFLEEFPALERPHRPEGSDG